jgi:hypothetical protein
MQKALETFSTEPEPSARVFGDAQESLSRETAPRRLAEKNLEPCRKDMGRIRRVDVDYVEVMR